MICVRTQKSIEPPNFENLVKPFIKVDFIWFVCWF